jgi:hypothetical protein
MTYLHCAGCGFTRANPFSYTAGTCPRCTARGEAVELIERTTLSRMPISIPIERMREARTRAEGRRFCSGGRL